MYCNAAQHALAPDAAPLRFAAQVKRKPLGACSASKREGNCYGVVGLESY